MKLIDFSKDIKMQNLLKKMKGEKQVTIEGSCDICGDKGQVTEKLDTYSMNYYNHCSKKECSEYKDVEDEDYDMGETCRNGIEWDKCNCC